MNFHNKSFSIVLRSDCQTHIKGLFNSLAMNICGDFGEFSVDGYSCYVRTVMITEPLTEITKVFGNHYFLKGNADVKVLWFQTSIV